MHRWCWWTLLPGILAAHELPEVHQLLVLTARDSVVCLGVPFVQKLVLQLDSVYTLQSPLDYEVAARQGCIRFSPHFRRLFRFRDTLRLSVAACYVPLFVQARGGKQRWDTCPSAAPAAHSSGTPVGETPEAPPVEPRGRLIRGFSLQTGSGLVLHSGLELGFSSHLAGQTEIGGRIVADRLPVSSAGSSLSVQELDQFALQVRSPGLHAEVGELLLPSGLQAALGIGHLQGVKASVRMGRWELATLLGASRTVTTVVVLTARDGVPGPYRLQDALGRRIAGILPGSERVWVDGVLQERGEDKDYVLDELRGELTFRPRRPVSSASHIVVEFSELDQASAQTLGFLQLTGALGAAHNLEVAYSHRLTTPFQDVPPTARPVLRNGMSYAQLEGATWVGFDSATGRGRGWYRRRDTLLGGQVHTIWEYAPAAPDAFYMVEFSAVGEGQGEYVQEAPGVFRYVGSGRGGYAPVRLLPLPTQQQLWTVRWEWRTPQWSSHLQWEGSRFVPFRRHSEVLQGVALSVQTRYSQHPDTARAPLLWESQTRWKSPFFFGRRTAEEQHVLPWNLLQRGFDGASAEAFHHQRFRLQLAPLMAEATAGWIRWAPRLSALWAETVLGVLPGQGHSPVVLRYAVGHHRDDDAGQRHLWHRLRGTVTATISRWHLLGDVRWQWQREAGVLAPVRQRELAGETRSIWTVSPRTTLEAFLLWRRQWEPLPSQWWQPGLWLRWTHPESWKLQLRLGWNRVQQAEQRWENLHVLWQASAALARRGGIQWRYESGTELTDTVSPAFLRVLPGQGTYRYRGDLNGNGIADPSEFEPAPVGGDYLLVPTSRGISRPGTLLRIEGILRFPLGEKPEPKGEWESQLRLLQRGVFRSWWQALFPHRAREDGVNTTQWTIAQQLRLPTGSAQWDARAEWSGTAFWMGTAWEQWQRATAELRWERTLRGTLRLACGGGPLWEEHSRAFQPGQFRLSVVQLFSELPWQPTSELWCTPRLQLLRGSLGDGTLRYTVVNPVGMLQLSFRRQDFLSAEAAVHIGVLVPALPPELLLWSGSLLQGWRLQGSVGYRTGGALWSLQYLGAQQKGRRWWHALNGQVQLTL